MPLSTERILLEIGASWTGARVLSDIGQNASALVSSYGNVRRATDEVAAAHRNLGSILGALNQNQRDYTSGLQNYHAMVTKQTLLLKEQAAVTRDLSTAQRDLAATQRPLQALGGLAGGVAAGAGLLAAFGALSALKSANALQQTAYTNAAQTAQSPAQAQRNMQADISYGLSGQTPYGDTAREAARYQVASIGVKGSRADDIIKVISQLGKIQGVDDLTPTSKLLTTMLTIGGTGARSTGKDALGFANELIYSSIAGKADVPDLVNTVGKFLGQGKAEGFTQADLLAFNASETLGGQSATQSSFNLGALVNTFSKPTAGQQAASKAYGVTLDPMKIQAMGGFAPWLQSAFDAFKGATDTQRTEGFAQLFGNRNVVRGIYAAAGSHGERLFGGATSLDAITRGTRAAQGGDLTNQQAAVADLSPQQQIKQAAAKFSAEADKLGLALTPLETGALKFGNQLLDVVIPATDTFVSALSAFGDWLDKQSARADVPHTKSGGGFDFSFSAASPSDLLASWQHDVLGNIMALPGGAKGLGSKVGDGLHALGGLFGQQGDTLAGPIQAVRSALADLASGRGMPGATGTRGPASLEQRQAADRATYTGPGTQTGYYDPHNRALGPGPFVPQLPAVLPLVPQLPIEQERTRGIGTGGPANEQLFRAALAAGLAAHPSTNAPYDANGPGYLNEGEGRNRRTIEGQAHVQAQAQARIAGIQDILSGAAAKRVQDDAAMMAADIKAGASSKKVHDDLAKYLEDLARASSGVGTDRIGVSAGAAAKDRGAATGLVKQYDDSILLGNASAVTRAAQLNMTAVDQASGHRGQAAADIRAEQTALDRYITSLTAEVNLEAKLGKLKGLDLIEARQNITTAQQTGQARIDAGTATNIGKQLTALDTERQIVTLRGGSIQQQHALFEQQIAFERAHATKLGLTQGGITVDQLTQEKQWRVDAANSNLAASQLFAQSVQFHHGTVTQQLNAADRVYAASVAGAKQVGGPNQANAIAQAGLVRDQSYQQAYIGAANTNLQSAQLFSQGVQLHHGSVQDQLKASQQVYDASMNQLKASGLTGQDYTNAAQQNKLAKEAADQTTYQQQANRLLQNLQDQLGIDTAKKRPQSVLDADEAAYLAQKRKDVLAGLLPGTNLKDVALEQAQYNANRPGGGPGLTYTPFPMLQNYAGLNSQMGQAQFQLGVAPQQNQQQYLAMLMQQIDQQRQMIDYLAQQLREHGISNKYLASIATNTRRGGGSSGTPNTGVRAGPR